MHNLRFVILCETLLILLVLPACYTPTATPPAAAYFLTTPELSSAPCEACDQATLAMALTQDKNNADNQAAATAEIVRANAQATLNSANSTLGAAQTQDQNESNVIAAQIAGTAEIVRANAQATVNSAAFTQSAALTQDAIRQTQMSDYATTGAQSVVIQQNKNDLASGTQTAVANNIATQTQVAAATSQWYADQARQREERKQGPLTFLWVWCFPTFILVLAGLLLWGLWRWLKIQQNNQNILENPVERLPASTPEIIDLGQDDDTLPHIESDISDNSYPPTKPDDQIRGWLEEVKHKLLRSDKKVEDDDTDD
jgi:hypothetical protein